MYRLYERPTGDATFEWTLFDLDDRGEQKDLAVGYLDDGDLVVETTGTARSSGHPGLPGRVAGSTVRLPLQVVDGFRFLTERKARRAAVTLALTAAYLGSR